MKRIVFLLLAGALLMSSVMALAADIRSEGLVQADRERVNPSDDSLVRIEDESTPLSGPYAPFVDVSYTFTRGDGGHPVVTLKAEVQNLEGGRVIQYQWQNNVSGDFRDVPGAVGASYSYILDDEYGTSCGWRVKVLAMH